MAATDDFVKVPIRWCITHGAYLIPDDDDGCYSINGVKLDGCVETPLGYLGADPLRVSIRKDDLRWLMEQVREGYLPDPDAPTYNRLLEAI